MDGRIPLCMSPFHQLLHQVKKMPKMMKMCSLLMVRPSSLLLLLRLLHRTIQIIQETVFGQAVIVISINVDCGEFLGGLVACVAKLCQQRVVLELGGEQEVGILWRAEKRDGEISYWTLSHERGRGTAAVTTGLSPAVGLGWAADALTLVKSST